MTNYVLLFLFGIGVGVLSGLLGIGGGIALVPGLIMMFGFSQKEAQGTSLAVLVPPIGIFAAMVYYQHGYVQLPKVGWVAFGFVVGALLGALLVDAIPQAWLSFAFGATLLYVGFMFVLSPDVDKRTAAALPAGLAALAVTVLGWILRRRVLKKPAKREPPSDNLEYHL
jgi:uncharacterized protein